MSVNGWRLWRGTPKIVVDFGGGKGPAGPAQNGYDEEYGDLAQLARAYDSHS